MAWDNYFRDAMGAACGVNFSALRLALKKPNLVRSYISHCLRKYDELMGHGLQARNPLRDLNVSDADTVTVPARFQTGGGTDPKEILTLAVVTRSLRPKRIFEIGTYNGRTTAVFALNAPPGCEVITLDLPPDPGDRCAYISTDIELVQNREPDAFLRRAGLAGRCRQIYCDSTQFDAELYRDSVELGFIDGAHALPFVQNDTQKMARMMSDHGLVFWHDYGGRGTFRPLSRYLESLPIRMFRVPGTSLAWTTAEEIKKILPDTRGPAEPKTNDRVA